MLDHLLKGRFLFGVSPGALESDAEALGIRGIDRNEMFAESIGHIIFPDDKLTLDFIVDSLVIAGDPISVVDQLLAFREVTGDFGTLLYAGKDWEDRSLGIWSMELMAEKVMPEVNAAIGRPEAAE